MSVTATKGVSREILERRFEEAVNKSPDGAFDPTPLGESLAWGLVTAVVQTAPDKATGLRAYQACEVNALDEMMDDVRATVVRHVARVLA